VEQTNVLGGETSSSGDDKKGEVAMKDEGLEQTEVERKILKEKLEQKLEALWKGEVDMKDEDLEQTSPPC
jgi:hypothetical protein